MPDRLIPVLETPRRADLWLQAVLCGLTLLSAGTMLLATRIQWGILDELRTERKRMESADQAGLDREVRLDAVRQRVTAQHADLIAQQVTAARISAENLRLATELNGKLKRSD